LSASDDGNRTSSSSKTEAARPVTADTLARQISVIRDFVEADRLEPILVAWTTPLTRVQRDIIAPAKGQWVYPRAMSSDTRSRLLSAIALWRRRLEDLMTGRTETIDALAAREGRSARSVSMLLSLAFLAPTSSKQSSTIECQEESVLRNW
jgi:hypothetical protein